MQLVWTLLGQRPSLELWRDRPLWPEIEAGPRPEDHCGVFERTVAVEPPGPPEPAGPLRRLAEAVCRFEVFPPWLVTPLRTGPAAAGEVLGVFYHPFPGVGLLFAARVTAVFDEAAGTTWRTGFTYRTVRGHPIIGEETFSVEKDLATGQIVVALRSWSRPGTLLARTFAPVIRRLQAHAANGALRHLAAIAEG
jgi:uncharacterized protein (UPF0548 family)